jgi:hypothetical protein
MHHKYADVFGIDEVEQHLNRFAMSDCELVTPRSTRKRHCAMGGG